MTDPLFLEILSLIQSYGDVFRRTMVPAKKYVNPPTAEPGATPVSFADFFKIYKANETFISEIQLTLSALAP